MVATEAFEKFPEVYENNKTRCNVLALLDRMLYNNKEKLIHIDVFCSAISNRINDIHKIHDKKIDQKILNDINKLSILYFLKLLF
jgi:hypothetical protein